MHVCIAHWDAEISQRDIEIAPLKVSSGACGLLGLLLVVGSSSSRKGGLRAGNSSVASQRCTFNLKRCKEATQRDVRIQYICVVPRNVHRQGVFWQPGGQLFPVFTSFQRYYYSVLWLRGVRLTTGLLVRSQFAVVLNWTEVH